MLAAPVPGAGVLCLQEISSDTGGRSNRSWTRVFLFTYSIYVRFVALAIQPYMSHASRDESLLVLWAPVVCGKDGSGRSFFEWYCSSYVYERKTNKGQLKFIVIHALVVLDVESIHPSHWPVKKSER